MKYRLAFFMTEVALLTQVTLYTIETMRGYAEAYAQLGSLFCPIGITGPPVFILLFAVAVVLTVLYSWPKNNFLWWLNLVGLLSISFGVFVDFHLSHLLMVLCVVLGLAYRRDLGLKSIWRWQGVLAVLTAVIFGVVVAFFGLQLLAERFT